jgi:hypothetical protein
MQLQRDPQSMAKPDNLPQMEIIKDNRDKVQKFKAVSTAPDWMSHYVKPTMSGPRVSEITWSNSVTTVK